MTTPRALLAPEGPALDLAVLRITVACVLTFSTSVAAAPAWAALPEGARTLPLGVGWLVPLLPITPESTEVVRAIFHVACLAGAVGLFTRASWIVVVLTAFYLLLVPQLGGAVFHDHHLLWLAVIVAASPAGDALSVDAWRDARAGRPRPTHGHAHGLAVRLAWCVIGLVFFFPGVHKLGESGLAWALSDNLRNQLWWKWAQDPTLLPGLRIDRSPALLRALALLTIAFELTFLPLVLAPRTRALAVLGACLFHAGAEHFMGIQFSALWATYTIFVPWQTLVDRLARKRAGSLVSRLARARRVDPTLEPTATRPLALVAIPLFTGIVVTGAFGWMQAYPFACYPTFQWMAPDRMPALGIEALEADGTRRPLDRAAFQEPGPRGWALSWRLAGVYGDFDRDAFLSWWSDAAERAPLREALGGARAIRVERLELDVDPDGEHTVLERRALGALLRTENDRWAWGELRSLPEP